MLVWLSAMWALHWGCAVGVLGLAGAVLLMSYQQRIYAGERRRDKRIRDEFEAYALLDARLRDDGDITALAKRVCRLVGKKSAFQRIAMLVPNVEGKLRVAGSVGLEELTVHALHEWGERVLTEESGEAAQESDARGMPVTKKSFAVVLGKESAGVGCGRAIIIPMSTAGGRIGGALAVCADRLMTMQRRAVEEAISPLETLAVKLGWALEDAQIEAERRSRIETSKEVGSFAKEMTSELSPPLTAVLGFAELIAETANETRVRADAEMISQEARRMREMMRKMLNPGRTGEPIDELVDVTALVRDLVAECEDKLDSRGVRLLVITDEDVPVVRGSAEGLRQVLEHVLNNAAQTIADASEGPEREQEIRVSVSCDAGSVQVIVSDTGNGFTEPGRVFEPARRAGDSAEREGTGLAICHKIVREHGGEISAFNLHPYGAAVMIELPLMEDMGQNFSGVVREVA